MPIECHLNNISYLHPLKTAIMSVLFVYSLQKSVLRKKPLKGQEDMQFGISYISAVLKENGYKTSLAVLDRRYGKRNYKTLGQKIQAFKPGIICFTSVNTEFHFICDIAKYVRQQFPGVFLLIGGVHVTLNPEEALLNTFDALCIGAGEYPVTELAGRLDRQEDYSDIPNLWVKQAGNVKKNPPRPFIEDLDALPFAERDIWQEWILEPNTRLTMLLGRGCPFNCTYCCNHRLRKTAPGKYVRLRSPENITREIEALMKLFPSRGEIFLEVESFGIDMQWMEALCQLLGAVHKATGVRFSTNLRIYPGMDAEQIFALLHTAGFDSVIIGLESGSERIRKEILNRNYTNADIIKAVKAAKRNGIKVGIFNMAGIPGETYRDFEETLHMNREIQPAWHATSVFFPYKGTELYEMAARDRLLPRKLNFKDERQKAVLNLPCFSAKQIQKAFDDFHFQVYKKAEKKNLFKYTLYFLQRFLGHNFMANAKLFFIRVLYKMRLQNISRRLKLFSIMQKS